MTGDSSSIHADARPGLRPSRLVYLMRDAISRCQLDLSGRTIRTEAATGAYAVTPVIAAIAGAKKVFAVTKTTRHGTVEQVRAETKSLARIAGVEDKIEIITGKTREVVAQTDIVTNSGHVRPIDAETINWMKPSAVVSLMYEAWEFRDTDVDLDACRRRGIAVAGTNERHPAIDVFSFLGVMAIKLLTDAGVAVYRSRILLLCDNPFLPFLKAGLAAAEADVRCVSTRIELESTRNFANPYDVILVALTPRPAPVVGTETSLLSAQEIAELYPTAVVAQFWGDIDRKSLTARQIPHWPIDPVPSGHMGILPASIGPEPIVRLQAGGLKVGELLARGSSGGEYGDDDLSYIQRF